MIEVGDIAPTVPPEVQIEEFPAPVIRKLDLACGQNKLDGWIGVDICATDEADIKWDLTVAPWPIEDASIDEARCQHFFEHLTPTQRIVFMNELYRVLKSGRGCILTTPLGYDRQVQDPGHTWPPIVASSYLYYDQAWLKENKLDHYNDLYGIECDFIVTPLNASVAPEFYTRSDEYKLLAIQQYRNGAYDLTVQVVKR